ncbi:MAG: hypothetical protein V8Q27_03945 [Eubacteriales bacterium]
MGRKSVLNDAEADAFQAGGAVKAAYRGLFGQIYGSVENVTLKDPTLELITDKENSYTGLKGIGILSGYSRGKLTGITVDAKKTETITADSGNKGTIYVDLRN